MLFKGTAYLYVGEGRSRVCSYRGVTLHTGTHTRTCTHTYAVQHSIQFTVGRVALACPTWIVTSCSHHCI